MLCTELFSPATCYAFSGVFRPVIRLLSEQLRKRDSISVAARDLVPRLSQRHTQRPIQPVPGTFFPEVKWARE